MDGIATQSDDSTLAGTGGGWASRLQWPEDVDALDFPWWDEQGDTFRTVRNCPLSVAGFVRLGGLNPSSAVTKNRTRRGSSEHVADGVAPAAHVKLSVPHSAIVLGDGGALVSDQRESVPACSATNGSAPNVRARADNNDSVPELNASADVKPTPNIEQNPFRRLQELSQRVKAGDDSAIVEIRQILDGSDALWRELGDMETTTEAMLIEFAEGTAASKESVRRSVASMKQSLLGEQPTPLEQMAGGRVIACWMFAHFTDRWCGFAMKHGGCASDLAKLLVAAEKRYGTALKSLKLAQEIRLPAS